MPRILSCERAINHNVRRHPVGERQYLSVAIHLMLHKNKIEGRKSVSIKKRVVQPLDLDIFAEGIISACFTVDQLIRLMRKKRGHITPQKCYVLHLLMKGCPENELGWTMSLLAKHLGISTAATTGLVDALVKKFQVKRFHVRGEDRRKIYVQITKVGRAVVKEYTSAFRKDLLSPQGGLHQLFFGSPKKV